MEVSLPCLRLVSSLTLLALVFFLVHVCYTVLLKSERIKRKLRMQGIQGPPPSFLYGNLPEMQKIQLNTLKASSFQAPDFIAHDYTSTVFPYFEQWRKEYGIRISLLYLLLSSYLWFSLLIDIYIYTLILFWTLICNSWNWPLYFLHYVITHQFKNYYQIYS